MLEHKCEVCGRLYRKKLKADGKIVCNKHYKQFKKYGRFIDNSPRTHVDKNNITIIGNLAYIDLYNKHYELIAQAIINAEDVGIVKNIKWKLNSNGYVINNSLKHTIFLHSLIMHTNELVDHKDTNTLNNTKENLRIATKSQNQMNVNYKGYSLVNNKWIVHIKLHQKQLHLGVYYIEEEAKYARWYAERVVFGEFAYPKEEPNISKHRKLQIQEYINQKVQRL